MATFQQLYTPKLTGFSTANNSRNMFPVWSSYSCPPKAITPSLSETWSYSNYKRPADDELQDLDWLVARPCLPKLTPLDAESPQKLLHNTWSSSMFSQFHSSPPSGAFTSFSNYPTAADPSDFPPPHYQHTSSFSRSGLEKPNMSYSNLIFLAILSSPRQAMTVNQIYEWCERHFAFYRGHGEQHAMNWKNSLRHNLSLNKGFHKLPRSHGPNSPDTDEDSSDSESGRGALWVIDPAHYESMLEATRKNPHCVSLLNSQGNGGDSRATTGSPRTMGSSPRRRAPPHGVTTAKMQRKSVLVNGHLMTWMVPVPSSYLWEQMMAWKESGSHMTEDGEEDEGDAGEDEPDEWHVVPQNLAGEPVSASKQDEEDFMAMVARLHLSREFVLAEQKLTEEEREMMPSMEEYPNLYKEMVAMQLKHKGMKKRRRRAAGGSVAFCSAPSLDHHYASHQMLLSPVANRIPCLTAPVHDFMLWFGSNLPELPSSSTEDDNNEDVDEDTNNKVTTTSKTKTPSKKSPPGSVRKRARKANLKATVSPEVSVSHKSVKKSSSPVGKSTPKRRKAMQMQAEVLLDDDEEEEDDDGEEEMIHPLFSHHKALNAAKMLLDVARTPHVTSPERMITRSAPQDPNAIANFMRLFRFNHDSSDESLSPTATAPLPVPQ